MLDLDTARLRLVPLSPADLAEFHAINTDAFVRRYLWDDELIGQSVSADILDQSQRCFLDARWGLWKIIARECGAYLGYAGLWCFYGETQPQLLCALHQHFTGQGYAREACAEIIAYAFGRLGFRYLLAATDEGNRDSAHLCKRLGFGFVEERVIDGSVTHFYRMENCDWVSLDCSQRS
ncbi:GNAT family N-acetyltransferase [Mangrovimicrobium sediminis]|nr:GNAT family N-acetyltransferase [Haliea sp. SAOS-164]